MRIKAALFSLLVFFLMADRSAFALGRTQDWIGSVGVGMAFAEPTLFLLSPELEYIYSPNLLLGGLAQMGMGNEFLLTASGSIRYLFTIPDSRIHPTVQGAFGLATASSSASDSMGVHLMMGVGIDYAYDRKMSFGTMLRFNFIPPIKSSFVSWPMVTGRFLL